MQKKDDKVGNKTTYKEEKQRKKREWEKKIEIDSQKKKSKFWLGACAKNKNAVLLHPSSQKICPFGFKTHI